MVQNKEGVPLSHILALRNKKNWYYHRGFGWRLNCVKLSCSYVSTYVLCFNCAPIRNKIKKQFDKKYRRERRTGQSRA